MRKLLALAAGCALVLAATASAEEAEIDLRGTWFVLVHYKDDNHHPERERWEDKVWVFKDKGSRLHWTEYPIVEFLDDTGRFENRDGRKARVLHFWEPSETQAQDIADGLQVNDRGMIAKSMKRTPEGDWRSLTRRTASSASIVSFVQNWSVESPDGLPIFEREDVLGSGEMEDMEGVTRYTTTEILPGPVFVGSYERDGTRRGTFRVMRSGVTEAVKGSGLTQGQRATQIPGVLGDGGGEEEGAGDEP